jgi:hypothetical protein
MFGNDRPELRAFGELEVLVRHLGEELSQFRRRALVAETQLKDGGRGSHGGHGKHKSGGTGATAALADRVATLESENETLRLRLDRAEDRVRQMLDRVRFLRQQLQTQPAAAAGGGRS